MHIMSVWAEKTLSSMSVDQKVGQLLCVRIIKWLPQVKELLSKGHIGGGYLVRGDAAAKGPDHSANFTNELQQLSPVPVLFSSGHEGIHCPITGATMLPRAMALGATRSLEDVALWARVIARESKALGIPWVDAPVLDVNINPVNPIISVRSFSERPDLVADMGAQVARIGREEKVITTGKHFPGHGDTSVDSHRSTPEVPFGRARLNAVELYPYRQAIDAGLSSVMTAHIRFPGVDSSGLPATLSKFFISGVLRDELGFPGIIITDSMTMRGIKNEFGIEKAAVMALKAGHDMILHDYESDPTITYNALLKAVMDGEVSMEQVDASVLRVLQAKEWLGLHENRYVNPERALEVVGCAEHKEIAMKIACDAITVLENKGFPLKPASDEQVLLISTQDENGPTISADLGNVVKSSGDVIADELRRFFPHVQEAIVFDAPQPEQRQAALEKAEKADHVVFACFVPLAAYREGSGAVPAAQQEFVRELRARSKHLTFLIYGPPYVLAKFPKADIAACVYGDELWSLKASVRVLCGEVPPKGLLPVTLSPEYPFGAGYTC